jgi:hypothetical protein
MWLEYPDQLKSIRGSLNPGLCSTAPHLDLEAGLGLGCCLTACSSHSWCPRLIHYSWHLRLGQGHQTGGGTGRQVQHAIRDGNLPI